MDGLERPPTTPASRAAVDAPGRPGGGLPTGTVTFLFTDVEGSTRLVERLGDRWPSILERHRAIIRAALAANAGVEVQTEGDGFFAAFASAPAAVAAAAKAQRDLAAEPWPADAPIRVRMGLHAGEGVTDEDRSYVGHDVHRAARVAGAGHGGQVLISETVRALVASALPAGVALRDLGEHRLKDLRPQPLAQLVIDGLPSDFPPLRSLDARPNNLPTQLTSFVGRDRELESAAELLTRTRLLTLTGPGGTGKTRLALQLAADVADDYPDGVWFVPLEPLRDASLVLPTVARVAGVVERPGERVLDSLAATIGDDRMLFVLDNVEQVIDAAEDVGGLLRACPGIRVVATSRAVLRISGEQEYVVPGLPAPPDTRRLSRVELENLPAAQRNPSPESLGYYEAVRLFIARAVAVRPDFSVTNQNAPAVAAICARLHGMPLAIELAAARVKLLTPDQILERLERQLGLLTSTARDLPDRQRTLRGAIAWSSDLLDETHRRLFASLSVFRGGWDLEEAGSVVAAAGGLDLDVLDGLAALVDQSLARHGDEADGTARFDMLEAIREFAAEMLEAMGEADAVGAAHAGVFLGLAEAAAPLLQGADQRAWLDRLDRDHDNLRAALAWSIGHAASDTAVRLAFALWRFWQQRGYLGEARMRFEAIDREGWRLPDPLRAQFAEAFGGVAYWQADLGTAMRWYDEALRVWRTAAAAGGEPEARRQLANALYNRGYVSVAEAMQSSVAAAAAPAPESRDMLEEALAAYRDLGDQAGEGNVLWGLGGYWLFSSRGDLAEPLFREAIELHRAAGHRTMEAWSLHMLSTSLVLEQRMDEARDASNHALRHFHAASDVPGITLTFDTLASIAVADGDLPRAGRLWGAARELQRVSGTGLADWNERAFAQTPVGVGGSIARDELERLAAEGASLPLAEAVAYALAESDPYARA